MLDIFLIGVALSMDAFSISLSIGAFSNERKKYLVLSLLIGIMHFIMPLIGYELGFNIVTFLHIEPNTLLGIILTIIVIEMIMELKSKEEKIFKLNFISMILIAFSVSLDSFTTGMGLTAITNNFYLSGIVFSICATSFTYMGLLLGNYCCNHYGFYAQILGIIILIFMVIKIFLHNFV